MSEATTGYTAEDQEKFRQMTAEAERVRREVYAQMKKSHWGRGIPGIRKVNW